MNQLWFWFKSQGSAFTFQHLGRERFFLFGKKIFQKTFFLKESEGKRVCEMLESKEWKVWTQVCEKRKEAWWRALSQYDLDLIALLDWIMTLDLGDESRLWVQNMIEDAFHPGHLVSPHHLKRILPCLMELDKHLTKLLHEAKKIKKSTQVSLFQTFVGPQLYWRNSHFTQHMRMVEPECRRWLQERMDPAESRFQTNLTRGTIHLWLSQTSIVKS